MDQGDVEHAKSKGNLNAKVGDVLWRAPCSIGPCGSEHSHWGGDLLTVGEADARLIAAAPDLLEVVKQMQSALSRCFGAHGPDEGDRHRALAQARAALAKATNA
jgi:hypothetical protein